MQQDVEEEVVCAHKMKHTTAGLVLVNSRMAELSVLKLIENESVDTNLQIEGTEMGHRSGCLPSRPVVTHFPLWSEAKNIQVT